MGFYGDILEWFHIYKDVKPFLFFASVRGSNETIILTEEALWRWLTLILLYVRLNNEQTKQSRRLCLFPQWGIQFLNPVA